jgi:DNA/RNA endonuclease YhcR with UshA esterase domain
MKILLSSMVFLAIALRLPAAQTNTVPGPFIISAAQTSQHYGQGMIVTGVVAEVNIRSHIVFLNLDQPYPNSPFTLVILPISTNQFGNIPALQGKNVEATGQIRNYHGHPEILLESSNQLKVVMLPAASTNATGVK